MQARTHRNLFYYVIPLILFGITVSALIWAIIRANLSPELRDTWPWKLQLLDVQSATTAATIAGGLVFARAQYANAVRPVIGWTGTDVKASWILGERAWMIRLVNGCPVPAIFHDLEYRIILSGQLKSLTLGKEKISWLSRHEAIARLEEAGLRSEKDFRLRYFGPAFPLSSSTHDGDLIAYFGKEAMARIEDVLIRAEAKDQAGDTHERVVYCMRGARRDLAGPDAEQFEQL